MYGTEALLDFQLMQDRWMALLYVKCSIKLLLQRICPYISTDHDPLFQFHRWKANLRILEIEKIKSIPFTPISHPYIERLIGTVRREFLDQTLFWNEIDLQKKLNDYTDYYNNHRVHASLNGTLPAKCGEEKLSPLAALTNYGWYSLCRGLYQLPIPT